MDFPTAKDLQKISEDVSKNDGNEILYNEYLEDLKERLTNMALAKNRAIYVDYRTSESYYGQLKLNRHDGYLDDNYTKKVFKMLDDKGYAYYHYSTTFIFSRKAVCEIWIED